MKVQFKPAERVNPRDLALPRKFYANVVNRGEVSFRELALMISRMSSLNHGVVIGALSSLIDVIEIQLAIGRSINLSELGGLYLTLKSDGAETPEELTADHIKGASIRFRPGSRLKELTKSLKFEKVATASPKTDTDQDMDTAA